MKLVDRENCQAIQLPLMAWNNSYLVDISGAAYQLRETRFLLELSNEQGQGFWAVADCRVPDFLPNVSIRKHSFQKSGLSTLYAL